MASYLVHYTYIGCGVMKVNARNKNAAQDIVDTKPQDELLQYCNFDDGLDGSKHTERSGVASFAGLFLNGFI